MAMHIYPANNTCWLVHYWQGLYGGLGHLYSPDRRTPPMPHLEYILDNGAFGAWKNGTIWSAEDWERHVEYYAFSPCRPKGCIVPDVVSEAKMTLARYGYWAPKVVKTFNLAPILAVQNGMTIADVRALDIQPAMIAIGGSTEWKWETLNYWAVNFPRVHVLRVNTAAQLELCREADVESVDGTGYFRGDPNQIADLGHFLRKQAGRDSAQDVEDVERVVRLSRTETCTRKRRANIGVVRSPLAGPCRQTVLALDGSH